MIVKLSLQPGVPFFSVDHVLDGVQYTLAFRWVARDSGWFFDLTTTQGEAVFRGVRVCVEVGLGSALQAPKSPPGRFLALDNSGKRQDPTLEDFGTRVSLFYLDLETMRGFVAGTL